jgi:nitrite reductase/ring-hydroxylating ferredoxin subunit
MEHDLFAVCELSEGAHRSVEIAGRKILVARVGGQCHAVGGICPHAGAPLGEGVLHDGVIICPWHKAAFRISTGEHVEPPAVDDLRHYPITIVEGRVRITIAAETAPGGPMSAAIPVAW